MKHPGIIAVMGLIELSLVHFFTQHPRKKYNTARSSMQTA
jgi:hypothetical protein